MIKGIAWTEQFELAALSKKKKKERVHEARRKSQRSV